MENTVKRNNLPFLVEGLTDSKISESKRKGKLFESKELPNKIIRVESFSELQARHGSKIDIYDLVDNAKRLYSEFENKYGILVLTEFYVGVDKVYTVVDKIKGKHFEEIENSAEVLSAVEKLYIAVAKYFLDKYKEGGLSLFDINGQSQYVYGKKVGDLENKIYLVDTDIWFNNNVEGICLSVYWLTRHLSWLEDHFGTEFLEARTHIRQFIDEYLSISKDGLENQNIDAVEKFLNHEKSDYDPKSGIPTFK